VSDLAAAHLTALDHLMAGGGSSALNAGTGRGNTVMEVLPAVEEVTQKRVPLYDRAPTGGRSRFAGGGCSQAAARAGLGAQAQRSSRLCPRRVGVLPVESSGAAGDTGCVICLHPVDSFLVFNLLAEPRYTRRHCVTRSSGRKSNHDMVNSTDNENLVIDSLGH
jgi:hypothetical protein